MTTFILNLMKYTGKMLYMVKVIVRYISVNSTAASSIIVDYSQNEPSGGLETSSLYSRFVVINFTRLCSPNIRQIGNWKLYVINQSSL